MCESVSVSVRVRAHLRACAPSTYFPSFVAAKSQEEGDCRGEERKERQEMSSVWAGNGRDTCGLLRPDCEGVGEERDWKEGESGRKRGI